MDGFKEFQGKDLDAAIQDACLYFNAQREQLEIEILQDAKSGIFGIVGARKAKIRAKRVRLRETLASVLGEEYDTTRSALSCPKNEKPTLTGSTQACQSEEGKNEKKNERVSPKNGRNAALQKRAKANGSPVSTPKKAERLALERSRSERLSLERTPSALALEPGQAERAPRSEQSGRESHADKNALPLEKGKSGVERKGHIERSSERKGDKAKAAFERNATKGRVRDEGEGRKALKTPREQEGRVHEKRASKGQKAPVVRATGAEGKQGSDKSVKGEAKNARVAKERKDKTVLGKEAKKAPKQSPETMPSDMESMSLQFDPTLMEVAGDLVEPCTKPFEQLDPKEVMTLSQEVMARLLQPLVDEEPQLSVQILDGRVMLSITGIADCGLLIGREGVTLAALQYLASRIVSRKLESVVRVQVEIGDYRQRQDAKIKEMALALANKVLESGKSVSTRPMSSYHRRIVHMCLRSVEGIQTRSTGEGILRRVLIIRKKTKQAKDKGDE